MLLAFVCVCVCVGGLGGVLKDKSFLQAIGSCFMFRGQKKKKNSY